MKTWRMTGHASGKGGRRRRWLWLAGALLFALWNLLAARHARAMLTFDGAGERTAPPEQLTLARKLAVLLTGVRYPRPMPDRTPAALGLAYESFWIEGDPGVRLAAWRVPAPAPARGTVLLFHGYTGTRSQVLPAVPVFLSLGYDAVLLDFRGRGESSGSRTTIGVTEARDVAAALRWARRRSPDRPVAAYGVSMGAAAILRAIAREDAAPDAIILEAVFDRLLTTVRNRFRSMGVPAAGNAELLLFWGGVQIGFNGFAHQPVRDARAARCPALVLHGANDPRARPAEGRAVYDALGSPRKQWVLFDGVGHDSCLEADPALWRTAVETLLATPLPSRP